MRLYVKYLGIHLKSVMQYRLSFLLLMLGQFLLSFSSMLALLFMLQRFRVVEGFSLPEAMLFFSVTVLSAALAEGLGRGFDRFSSLIADGSFDRMLVRPRGLVFQVFSSQVELTRLGRILQALLVAAYALPRAGVAWTPERLLCLLLAIICGSVLAFCLYVVQAALSFFTLDGLEVMNIFTDGGREFGKYPYSIYGRWVLRFLTYGIPLALTQYYPMLYVLGRSDSVLHMLSPLLSLWFVLPSYGLWRLGLKHYRSTGS